MLNADVDPLGENPDANTLVHNNTDSPGGDVVDAAGPALVVLVGHTLVNSTINLDVHNVADLEHLQVGGQVNGTLGTEPLGEQVAGARTVSLSVTHTKSQRILLNFHNSKLFSNCNPVEIFGLGRRRIRR